MKNEKLNELMKEFLSTVISHHEEIGKLHEGVVVAMTKEARDPDEIINALCASVNFSIELSEKFQSKIQDFEISELNDFDFENSGDDALRELGEKNELYNKKLWEETPAGCSANDALAYLIEVGKFPEYLEKVHPVVARVLQGQLSDIQKAAEMG